MPDYVARGDLSVAAELADFVDNQLLVGTDVTSDRFWSGFDAAVHRLAARNRDLLALRDEMQSQIDQWLRDNAGLNIDADAYTAFLSEIGYLVEEGPDFSIDTTGVDPEIAGIDGPQLVVPITNARYALNAANARWGSLYNALYGTDITPGSIEKSWDQERAKKVINFVRDFLDERIPLAQTSWKNVSKFKIEENKYMILCSRLHTRVISVEVGVN